MLKKKKRNSLRVGDTFYCKNLKTILTVGECLDNYVNVNALNHKESYCYKCIQGQRLRNAFARGG